ncbi:superoxide dismutase family protein [Salinisphaera shabanensis]|uniref:superoxide dismutase family protein n=1 Tax=Salinisphaera shabanensis TaxID=180542 RepID=UPI003341757B
MMKSVVSVSAAMLLAMSLTACGNNDDQNEANADTADTTANAETNTASENSGDMAADSGTQMESDSQADGESQMGDDAMMNGDSQANNDSGMASGDSAPASEDMPQAAVAVLHGTEGNDGVSATIRFTPQDGGVAYTTEAEGLAPGKHGYHIHLYGDCSAGDGKSAGTHFNLEGSSKNPPADIDRITGDLGDLDVGEDGSASDEGTLDGASLTGAKALIGRGVIIHEKANDPNQPPIGAAGSRQACGVIGIAEADGGMSSNADASGSNDSSMSDAEPSADANTSSNSSDDSDSSM